MTMTSAASTLGNSWNRLAPNVDALHAEPLAASLAATPPWAPAALAASEPPRGKVLIVEDEADVALALQRTLREAGFRTVGPAAALSDIQQHIDRGAIDCAILDVDVDRRAPLPVADLLAFVDVPFVYLSAVARPVLPPQHRRRPVVEKPFSHAALVAAVEKTMAERRAATDTKYGISTAIPWPRVYPPL